MEHGLVQQVLDVLHNGPYDARNHAAYIVYTIMSDRSDTIGLFCDGGIIECVLPLLESTKSRKDLQTFMGILKCAKRFCVAHGSGGVFLQVFTENNGHEILEQVADMSDKLIAEDATVFLKEMDRINES